MTQLTKEQFEFIEGISLWGDEIGMPKSMGKVLGYLMICEPSQQSAAGIQEALHLSSGSVSNALSWLKHAELVKKRMPPGHRHYLYEMEPGSWRKVALKKLDGHKEVVKLANRGLEISPGNSRIADLRDMYTLFGSYANAIRKQLDEE